MEHEIEHQYAGIQRCWELVHKQQEPDSSTMKLKGNKVVRTRQKIRFIYIIERYQVKAAS